MAKKWYKENETKRNKNDEDMSVLFLMKKQPYAPRQTFVGIYVCDETIWRKTREKLQL